MIPIREYLNKIQWDKRENPKDYIIGYHDRVLNIEIVIPYISIVNIEEGFLKIYNEKDEFSYIPTHRIRKLYKKGKVVWKRIV